MPLTRRRFVASSTLMPFALRSFAQTASRSPRWLYLGTDKGPGIFRAPWDASSGAVGRPVLAIETDRPDFFALHPSLSVLYTVNSVAGPKAGVSAYAVDEATGSLSLLNRMSTHGDGPCFVSVDRTGHAVYTANYSGGSVTAYRVGSGGELAETVGVLAYTQPEHGPVADRQDAAHLHCTVLSPGNDFVLVCDLGDDLILAFPVTPEKGAGIQTPLRVAARRGSGPRHVAFHPNGRWLYCIHELDCTVDLYDWSVAGGAATLTMRTGSTVSVLEPGDPPANNALPEPAAPSTGCELVVSKDGRFLITCTRGADSLVVYRIGAETGLLTRQQRLSCGGRIPRLIAFDPSERWLLCMNQASSNVAVFARDQGTGRLDPQFRSVAADTPMCAVWV